jgi:hypothetical protein
MLRVLYLLFSSVTLVGCAHQQPPMVWIRLDGQKATGDPVLTQQFETDRTICLGKTQQANLSGVAVYQGGIYGAIAASERAQAVDAVAKGCMAEKGYTQVWPAPGLDDTDLSESGPALELHRA